MVRGEPKNFSVHEARSQMPSRQPAPHMVSRRRPIPPTPQQRGESVLSSDIYQDLILNRGSNPRNNSPKKTPGQKSRNTTPK